MPTPRPLQPGLIRPLRFPRDLLRILYWAYARPWTLERYLQQFDPDLRLGTGLWALWRRGKTHPPLRHLVYLALFHILITPWLAFPLAGLLHLVGMPVNWWGVLGGVLGGVLEGVAFGGGFIGGALLGALRLYEYPLWAGLSAGLALLDHRGRGFRLLPPLWHEVIPLPLPGVGRYLRALGRRDPAAARGHRSPLGLSLRLGAPRRGPRGLEHVPRRPGGRPRPAGPGRPRRRIRLASP